MKMQIQIKAIRFGNDMNGSWLEGLCLTFSGFNCSTLMIQQCCIIPFYSQYMDTQPNSAKWLKSFIFSVAMGPPLYQITRSQKYCCLM